MGFLYEGASLASVFGLLLFVGAWVALNELSRSSKGAAMAVFCGLPVVFVILAATGITGSPSGATWFGWVKVFSALMGVWGFMAIRFTGLGNKKFAWYFPFAILSLNILEAVYREFEVFVNYKTLVVDDGGSMILGGPWNILNAIAGILTIVTLTGFVGIRVSNNKKRDMVWPDMTWMYIIGYTLWNFAYVYNCISLRSMYAGFGILVAALISEFVFRKGVWLEHRAQILSLYAMFALSFEYMKSPLFQFTPTYNQAGLMILSVLAFVFNLGVFIYMIYKIAVTRRNPLKEELYTDTRYYKKSIEANNL